MRPRTLSTICYASAVVSAIVAGPLVLVHDIIAAVIVWALAVVLFVCGQTAAGLYAPADPKAERKRLKAAYDRALARNDRRGAGEVAKRFRAATNECLKVGK